MITAGTHVNKILVVLLLFAFLSARLKSLKKEVGLPDQQQH